MAQVTNLEDSSREQIEEALGHFVAASKGLARGHRQVGNSNWTSPWDIMHASIDELLDRWEVLRLEAPAAV